MVNEKYLLITNIFFIEDKNILIIKGLDKKYTLNKLEYPMLLNNRFLINISLVSEFFIEKKIISIDERAFECKQNLDQLKGIDLALNILRLDIS
ncbi:hypothetical protein EV144_1011493 [Flavobacterium sp. 270]|uniref:hypothetical protein n=1 Tax=Flavobacterium sp. 270 TaxID=2512114 RepID=UPI001065AFB3|nr:hypothetical protein [Flavobacterium sp. 270]TDW52800.1 hypothetical protein EV144_1011493 [Flavobacterium sp. 270]